MASNTNPDCLHSTVPRKKCYGNCGGRKSAGYDHKHYDGIRGAVDSRVKSTTGNRKRKVFLGGKS